MDPALGGIEKDLAPALRISRQSDGLDVLKGDSVVPLVPLEHFLHVLPLIEVPPLTRALGVAS